MSDTARPKSAAEKLSAAEVNQDLPIVLTAGETINGATLPVAIYVKPADGEVYACDADDTAALEFLGFAVSNGTDGNSITIQKNGVVSGFTGLTAGSKYYVQDDKTIGTTPGTYKILVGIAVSTTSILILQYKEKEILYASDNLKASTDTERTRTGNDGGVYMGVKGIRIRYDGTVRVKFDFKVSDAGSSHLARIYVNDVAVGTIRTITTETTYQTYSEDIAVNANDNVRLKWSSGSVSLTIYTRNFRIYYDKRPSEDYIVTED